MPSIGLLAFSRIADDPRVRRQGDSFRGIGWTVIGVGLTGGLSPAPAWPILADFGAHGQPPASDLAMHARPETLPAPLRTFSIMARRAVRVSRFLRARGSLSAALSAYWSFPHFQMLYNQARLVTPDIWLANDWDTLPIAARLADETGVPFGYDSHEFAISEYEQRMVWRVLQRPMIANIEAGLIHRAAVVSSVSPGISRALAEIYKLARPPITIFNSPRWEETPFRATLEPARVLYHGTVAPGRGLEETVQSVEQWRNGRTLTIRGPSSPPTYAAHLATLAKRQKVSNRVVIEGPVPMTSLVEAARHFDIGILALPGYSRQNMFALPNKLFEYTMAGLALCMSDLPEMAGLISKHGLGITVADNAPSSIASAINSLDRHAIDAYKRNSIAAARGLSWDSVSGDLIEAYCQAIK